MQSQNTLLNSVINYNMLINNHQKMNNNKNVTGACHFSTSTTSRNQPYATTNIFMETTANIGIDSNNSYKTFLSEVSKPNQEFKQNLNEKPFNMEYQVAADMLKQESPSYYKKNNPETKLTPPNSSSYKVDFYPVVSGLANFITGIFNNITKGGWAFSNKNTQTEKEEKLKMFTPSHFDEKEDLSKYSLFEEFSCLHEDPPSLFYDSEISLNNIQGMENDVTLAAINSQVEYENKSVSAEQSALLNSFQSCRSRSDSPAFISYSSIHANTNESENIHEKNKKENKDMYSQNMPNCIESVEKCEDKLAKIKEILRKGGSNKQVSDTSKTTPKSNRRRRLFVPPQSIKIDSLEEEKDSIEMMQNIMATNFSHPGLIVDPEIVQIEPWILNKNTPDEVDFCGTNILITQRHMSNEKCPLLKLKLNNVYLDSLKSSQDCLLRDTEDTMNGKNNDSSEPALHSTKTSKLFTNSATNKQTDVGNAHSYVDVPSSSSSEVIECCPETFEKAVISNCEDKMTHLKEFLSKRKERKENTTKCNSNSIQYDITDHQIGLDAEKLDNLNYECMSFDSVITKKPSTKLAITTDKPCNRKHKNPNCRSTNKDKGRRLLRKNINEDISMGRDLSTLDLNSSLEEESLLPNLHHKNQRRAQSKERCKTNENPRASNIPEAAFDEVKGKFKTSASDCSSDDSFIIVFSESPVSTSPAENTLNRQRMPSDAGSEDSFIICFESDNENGNCYTSTEVFNESDSESDSDLETESSDSDSDSDICFDEDLQSNLVNCSFGNSMSRTVSDLTDESLYADDSVLARTSTCDSDNELDKYEMYCDPSKKFGKDCVVSCMSGSRIKESRKKVRAAEVGNADKPVKKVRFSEAAPRVLVLRVWAYAARAARAGPWEGVARDRERFRRRICDVDMAISWVLKPQHRTRVKFQRFMPWWNAQRRLENANKKKAEEDKIKKEADSIKLEEECIAKEDEDSQDEIVEKANEIRQSEAGIEQENKNIRQECEIEDHVKRFNDNLRCSNIARLNGKEILENNSNKDGNISGKNTIKDYISKVVKKDEPKNDNETNKPNSFAIQAYKGDTFNKSCIDTNKILIHN